MKADGGHEDLTKRYGETLAPDGLDLSVETGEVYCYLGSPEPGRQNIANWHLRALMAEAGFPGSVNRRSAGRAWHYVAPSGHCPVDLAAVAHPHDQDDELLVHDFVDDPVIANAQPVAVFVPGELLDVGVRAAWIVAERGQRPQDRQRGWLGHGPQLPDRTLSPPERVLHATPLPGSSSKIAATTSDML